MRTGTFRAVKVVAGLGAVVMLVGLTRATPVAADGNKGAAAHAVDPPGSGPSAASQSAGAAGTVRAAAGPSLPPAYWLMAADGGIYQFGTAYDGSMRGRPLNRPVVGLAATPDGGGYWEVASDGGIFSFGDAGFHGSTGALRLNRPVVGMAPTPDGRGYWLVASDGGIFSFGDAPFLGSTGAMHLNAPVLGMAANPVGRGYWLVAADGGIFTFGNAPFYGSTGAMRLNRPVVGMAANPHGGGYWLVASDGGIFTFGSVPFWGSTGAQSLPFPIIAMAATTEGFPYLQGATGNDISWPQCGGAYPPPVPVTVVGVNGGLSHNSAGNDISRNPCFVSEAAWAGPNLTVYLNTDGVPDGDPPSAASGPAGVCAPSDLLCQGYNWGWDGAVRSVGYAHAVGLFPTVWWLDVEAPCGFSPQLWRCDSLDSNARVIQGAIDGLRASGMIAGIYSTFYQFPRVAGSGYAPATPLWIPGATDVADAASRCGNTSFWFGGGTPWLIQYGYINGPPVQFDPDYACPQG